MNQQLFIKNRQKFVEQMDDYSVAILFAGEAKHRTADQEFEFVPNRNFFYLTGIDRQDFILVITKYNQKVDETLYIHAPNFEIEKWTGIRMRDHEAKAISGVEKVAFLDAFEGSFNKMLSSNAFRNIYLDTEYRTVGFTSKSLDFAKHVQAHMPYLQIQSASQIIYDLRTLKEPEEVDAMIKANQITKVAIEALMKNAKPGLTESQLEAYFDFAIKFNGSKSRSFKTIAASGANATILHYEENNAVLQDGQLILFDLGCEYHYYCSDISRTFPVNGRFTDRQKEVYQAVLDVQEKMISLIKPGLLYKDFQGIARDLLAEACIKLGLITDKKEVTKYYYHGIGHYLGLDVHDVGRYDMNERALEPGMVVTVEPGLYIAEEHIGIRIEDNILVTHDGNQNLSTGIIKTVEEIEAFMKK
jgi:Xaa-Pro aminopeptidase